MCPSPQAWHVRSSATGATAADGTGPVQPTSRGDASPAGAVCGVAEASTGLSEPAAAPSAGAVAARAVTTRSAPQASQKLESAGLSVPQTGHRRDGPSALPALPSTPASGSKVETGAGCGSPAVGK